MRTSSTLLVLDMGGVVLMDPLKEVFDRLAALSVLDRDKIAKFYSEELRPGLWNGALSEEDFWVRLLTRCQLDVDLRAWRQTMGDCLRPLAAAGKIQEWSSMATLATLTNHRPEWVYPALKRQGLLDYFSKFWVSAEVGLVKPDPAAFSLIASAADRNDVLFVDDKASNVGAAEGAGIPALLATDDGRWLRTVDSWLDRQRRRH